MISKYLNVEEYLSFSSSTDTPVNTTIQNDLSIIERSIKGWSKRVELEPGLYIQICNMSILQYVSFAKTTFSQSEKLFINLYFLEPNIPLLEPHKDELYTIPVVRQFTATFSNHTPVELFFDRNTSIESIVISFTNDWIYKQIKNGGITSKLSLAWMNVNTPFFILRRTSKSELAYARKLFHHIKANLSILSIKAYAYSFLNQIVKNISNYYERLELKQKKQSHHELILQIESKMMASIQTTMPSIKELAREFYISESTLKRHFKQVFGKNVYGYYIEKKMELAHELLTKHSFSVSQTAFYLEYKTVSHFITIFKKVYHYSPSQIQKKAKESNIDDISNKVFIE